MITIKTTFDSGKTSVQNFKNLETYKDSVSAKKKGIKVVQLIEPITQIVLAIINIFKK